jgi:integrase/recombinase XerC
MRDAIDAFHRHLQDRHAARTARTYRTILSSLAEFLDAAAAPGSVPSRTDIEAFLARPLGNGERRSAATRNQELAAIRSFAKFAIRDAIWPVNPTDGIPFAREAPRDPAVLTLPEVRRLFEVAACGTGGRRARDLALLALLSQAGLRVHELVALRVDQVDFLSSTLVAVHGKGGSVHDLPLNAPTLALILAWLAERDRIAKSGESALFVSSRGTRLSVRSVQHLMASLRGKMGSSKKISPHSLRHTCATLLVALGENLVTVASLLRHEDLRTTTRYVALADSQRRTAVSRLAVAIPPNLVPAPPTPVVAGPEGSVIALPERAPRPADVSEVMENRLDVQHALDAMDEAA